MKTAIRIAALILGIAISAGLLLISWLAAKVWYGESVTL